MEIMDNLIWELSVKMAFCLRLELVPFSPRTRFAKSYRFALNLLVLLNEVISG